MPFPTPIPSFQQQIIDQATAAAELAFQQRAIGVLLLAMVAIIIVAIGYTIKQWSQRNAKPDNNNATIGEVLVAFGQMNKDLLADIKESKAYQRLKDEQTEKRFEAQNERDIESNMAMSDAVTRLGDVLTSINSGNQLQSQTVLAMQTDVRKMTEVGSVPLQHVVITSDATKEDTTIILELIKKIEEQLRNQADCVDITDRLKRIEELVIDKLKRDTATFPAAVSNTVNVLPDTGAGELDKAS